MAGDAQGQPAEGAVTLSDLAAEMDAGSEENGEQVEDEAGEAEVPDSEEEAEEESEEDESEEADDDAEDDQEEPTVVLKHDGKEVTLKQSEVVALAQQGFDYSKKTMAVAEERKAVEAEKAKAAEHREQFEQASTEAVHRLEAFTQFLEADIGAAPDVALAAQDAALYLAKKEQHEQKKGKLQQAYAQIKHIQDEQARQRQAWIAESAASTEAMLKDTLPGWNDKTLTELAEYAKEVGLTPQTAELAMLTPGFWQMAQKAKAFDVLQAEKAKLKPKNKLPKVHKPSGANHPNRSEVKRADAEKRYGAKPSLDTLSALIE